MTKLDLLTVNDDAGRYPASYYAHATPELAAFAPAAGDIRTDVCIVGAGFTGLSAAYHLARRGYKVTVLEAQRVGFGASGRNGGQVGTGQRLDQDELEKLVGKDHAKALWKLSLDSVALVRELAAMDEVNVNFHDGVIHAAHRARIVPHEHAYADKLNDEYGYDRIRKLDLEEMRHLVGSEAYFGGTIDMGAGHLNPLAFALGLAKAASKAGASIHEGSKALEIVRGNRPVVKTADARIEADHLILACNGYLQTLERHVQARVMPINNYILATEPVSDEVRDSVIRGGHAVADSKFVINYFRFSEDNRLLFGGTESYRYRFPKDIAANVRRPMLDLFPQLKDVRTDFAWGGTLAITMNRMPHFERLAGNILSLSGYSGHGVALATLGGQIAAETIAGQAERFDVMATVPTHKFPGGAAFRSPLLVLAMLWFSMRDKL